jgi:prevent-host-death family protein
VYAVGVRELKEHASDIVRRVRERGETIEVTYRGRVVARLVPVEYAPVAAEQATAVWADLDQLAAEIGAHWPAGVTAAEAVGEQRRAL